MPVKLNTGDAKITKIRNLLKDDNVSLFFLGSLYLLEEDRYEEIQDKINIYLNEMPDLLPTQYYYMLAKTGIDQHVQEALAEVRKIDLDLYAVCQSQLTGARYFEWSKSYQLYLVVKNFLINLDPDLNYTETQLKSYWTEASKF